jgi:hypothetical protein
MVCLVFVVGCDEKPQAAPAPVPASRSIDNAADEYRSLWSACDREACRIATGFDYATDPPTSVERPPVAWSEGERALVELQGLVDGAVEASTHPCEFDLDRSDPFQVVGFDDRAAMAGVTRILAHETMRRFRDGDSAGAAETFAAMIRLCRHMSQLDVMFAAGLFDRVTGVCDLMKQDRSRGLAPEDAQLVLDDLAKLDPIDPMGFEANFRRETDERLAFLRARLQEAEPGAVLASRFQDHGIEPEQIAATQKTMSEFGPGGFWNGRFRFDDILTVYKRESQPVASMPADEIGTRIDAAERQVDEVIVAMRTGDVDRLQRVVQRAQRDESQILSFVLMGAVAQTDVARKAGVDVQAVKDSLAGR